MVRHSSPIFGLLFTLAAFFIAAPVVADPASPTRDDLVRAWGAARVPKGVSAQAQKVAEHLVGGDFAAVFARLAPAVKPKLPTATLEKVWKQVISPLGDHLGFGSIESELTPGGNSLAVVRIEFANADVELQLGFNSSSEINGLWLKPAPKPVVSLPSYVPPGSFREEPVTVGNAPWELPGTLTLPATATGRLPAVVLIHGSGPNDRDETVGARRPFRDIALGLAARGVASLRYEKRTRHRALQIRPFVDTMTVEFETITDAVAAVRALRTHPALDPQKLFVLGHSLGGYLLPRIATAAQPLAGGIILAGSNRPLEDLLLDQYHHLFNLDALMSDEERGELEKLKAGIALVKSPALSPRISAASLPLNIPASYWLDLRDYDAPAAAASLSMPLLILQGGRDYQVTEKDYLRWKEGLKGRNDASWHFYPALNHLFGPGSGPGDPKEYFVPGNIPEAVIVDIADWINKP